MPYIYSLAGAVHFEDYTIMRSLLFDFPEDRGGAKGGGMGLCLDHPC